MKLKCVVVDDEPLAREVIEKYIEVVDYLELTHSADNAIELHQIHEKEQVDIIFLDIEMPLMSGIDFLKITQKLPMIIITTAYPEYALEGFRFDVIDYLVKPITFNRFFKAANKALKQYELKHQVTTDEAKTDSAPYFFLKCDQKYEKIFTNQILYIQSQQNYLVIHIESAKFMSLMPLKTIEENLNEGDFIQVHKSYIVSLDKIQTLENHQLILKQGHTIPIGRSFRKRVQETVLADKILRKNA